MLEGDAGFARDVDELDSRLGGGGPTKCGRREAREGSLSTARKKRGGLRLPLDRPRGLSYLPLDAEFYVYLAVARLFGFVVGPGRGEHARVRIGNVGVDRVHVRMIEQVGERSRERGAEALRDAEALRQAQVLNGDAEALEGIRAGIAECPFLWHGECSRVEPLVGSPVKTRIGAGDGIGQSAAGVGAGGIGAGVRRRDVGGRGEGRDELGGPSAKHGVHNTGRGGQEFLLFAERQRPGQAGDPILIAVGGIARPLVGDGVRVLRVGPVIHVLRPGEVRIERERSHALLDFSL